MSEEKDNGGLAFPDSVACAPSGDIHRGMPGMTLRDYFAAAALQGFLANNRYNDEDLAEECYHTANRMLKARNKGE